MKISKMPSFPCVMGIVNVTPDSFYAASRMRGEQDLRERVQAMIEAGVAILDIGACSTRPNAVAVTEDEEWARLQWALPIVGELCRDTSVLVSVDTFRAHVAEQAIARFSVNLINDISGGTLDADMLPLIAHSKVHYVMMHTRGTPDTMTRLAHYPEGVTAAVAAFFSQQLAHLHALCSSERAGCVILDPGFGFAKTCKQNYDLLHQLSVLVNTFASHPFLIGVSRKRMVQEVVGSTAEGALNGTIALQTAALIAGADILRAHDVAEAVTCCQIVQAAHLHKALLSSSNA